MTSHRTLRSQANHNASHPLQPTQSDNRNAASSTNQWIKNGMNDKEDERYDCGALGNSRQNVVNSTAAELQLNLSPRRMITPNKVSGKCDALSNFDSGCSVDQVDDDRRQLFLFHSGLLPGRCVHDGRLLVPDHRRVPLVHGSELDGQRSRTGLGFRV